MNASTPTPTAAEDAENIGVLDDFYSRCDHPPLRQYTASIAERVALRIASRAETMEELQELLSHSSEFVRRAVAARVPDMPAPERKRGVTP